MPWLDVMEMAGVAVAGLTGTMALGVTLTAWLGWVKSPVVVAGRARVSGPRGPAGDERPTLPQGIARPVYRAPAPWPGLEPSARSVAVDDGEDEQDAAAYLIGYSDGWVDGAEGKPPAPPSSPRLTGDS